MKDITIIIPIHKINDDINKLLLNAYDSVKNMKNEEKVKISIVGPSKVIQEVKKNINDSNIIYIKNDGDTSFCNQVNIGVKECTTKYFSILEFDDKYNENWILNFEKYLPFYNDVSVFMPLTELTDTNGKILGFINEVTLASSFSNELGFLDLDCLQVYMDFNVTGSIIRTEDFNEIGGLKPSLKLASWYEFLMRLCYNGKKIYTIPKIGYSHIINRNDSLMKQYQEEISLEEGTWLIKTAKQEYFFKEDRKKEFQKK